MRSRTKDEIDRQALAIVGQAVRIARERSALSQRGLAARSGVSQTAISRMERGRVRGMGLVYFARVVHAMGDAMTLVGCPHGHGCDYDRHWKYAVRQVSVETGAMPDGDTDGRTLFDLTRDAERMGIFDVLD